jgi:hypothetical protein
MVPIEHQPGSLREGKSMPRLARLIALLITGTPLLFFGVWLLALVSVEGKMAADR